MITQPLFILESVYLIIVIDISGCLIKTLMTIMVNNDCFIKTLITITVV
jgi:hypothetical protein